MARAGAVWVDVLPSLATFNGMVMSQANVALDGVGAATGKGYGLALTKSAKEGMSGLTAAVQAQAKAAGDAAAAAVDAAEAKVAAARKRSLDAAGAVTVSEAKLKDLRDGNNVAAGRLAAAEEAVAKAQRNAQLSAESLTRAQSGLTTAQERQAVVAESAGAAAAASSGKFAGFASSVESGSSKITSKVGELAKGVGAIGGLFAGFEVAKFAGESVKAAMDFEKSSQVLVNAAGESRDKLGEIKQGMLDISSATGTDLDQLSEGMYTVEKAGQHGAAGLKILSDAAKLARDENADLQVVTNALTTVMTTSNGTITDSAKASNALMVAAGNSKTSLQEFSSSLSSVLPVSSKVGVGFDQISGALGAMTAQGMSASQASENLNHVITALASPTRVQATEMQAFGISAEGVRDNLGKRGLQGTIELLSDAVKSKLTPDAKHAADVISGMPAKYQDLWSALENGTTTLSSFEKKIGSAKDLTSAQKDEITKAIPASQGYFQAMQKMTGGITGLNVSMMLTGSNADKFTESTKAVAEAMGNADEFNDKWNATQQTSQVRLDQAKDTLKAVGISVATNLLPSLADAAKGFGDLVKNTVEFVKQNWDWVKPVAIGIGAIVGVVVAWTIAQTALNAVMSANPVLLIVVAIGALVVGLIAAYNHFETFHKIVDAVWDGIKTAVSATVSWITETAWPALQKAWSAISDAGVAVWHALQGAWDGIYGAVESVVKWVTGTAIPALQAAWKAIGDAAVWLWHTIIEPVWEGIKVAVAIAITAVVVANKILVALWEDVLAPALSWLWHTIFEPAWLGIQAAVSAGADLASTAVRGIVAIWQDYLAPALLWLWHNVFEPMWAGIQDTVRAVVDWITGTAWPAINSAWHAIADAATWLWHAIIEPVWNGIQTAIRAVVDWIMGTAWPVINNAWHNIADAALWLWHSVIEPVWGGIQSTVRGVADWFTGTVVTNFNAVRDQVGGAFNTLKDTISTAWNAIRDTAKAPISFVVNTVFAGLVNTYNSVADKVGATKFDVPHVNFASGGIMPGYSPGQDIYQFVEPRTGMRLGLSGGEPILRPEAGAVLGEGWVNGINGAARSGGQGGVRSFLGYADGGVFPGGSFAAADGAFDWMKNAVSSAASAVSGAVSNIVSFVTDPVGAFKSLGQGLIGAIPGGAAIKDLVSGVAGKVWDGLAQMVVGASQNGGGFGGAAGSPGSQSAVAWAMSQVGTSGWLDRCLAFVNAAWAHSVPWLGLPHAIDAWNAAPGKHPGDMNPPGGAALFYNTGNPAGHTDLAVGDGTILTTDLPTANKVGRVSFSTPMSQWGARYLGWAMPDGSSGTVGAGAGGAGVQRWASLVGQMLALEGQPSSLVATTLRRMNQESGGDPNAINNWDSNARAGIPSKGLMQVIDPTFNTFHDPRLAGNIWDPAANIAASMRYTLNRYKSLPAGYDRAGGYATGGMFKPLLFDQGGYLPMGDTLVRNEVGHPEPLGRLDLPGSRGDIHVHVEGSIVSEGDLIRKIRVGLDRHERRGDR